MKLGSGMLKGPIREKEGILAAISEFRGRPTKAERDKRAQHMANITPGLGPGGGGYVDKPRVGLPSGIPNRDPPPSHERLQKRMKFDDILSPGAVSYNEKVKAKVADLERRKLQPGYGTGKGIGVDPYGKLTEEQKRKRGIGVDPYGKRTAEEWEEAGISTGATREAVIKPPAPPERDITSALSSVDPSMKGKGFSLIGDAATTDPALKGRPPKPPTQYLSEISLDGDRAKPDKPFITKTGERDITSALPSVDPSMKGKGFGAKGKGKAVIKKKGEASGVKRRGKKGNLAINIKREKRRKILNNRKKKKKKKNKSEGYIPNMAEPWVDSIGSEYFDGPDFGGAGKYTSPGSLSNLGMEDEMVSSMNVSNKFLDFSKRAAEIQRASGGAVAAGSKGGAAAEAAGITMAKASQEKHNVNVNIEVYGNVSEGTLGDVQSNSTDMASILEGLVNG